jgi:hypothetical protein
MGSHLVASWHSMLFVALTKVAPNNRFEHAPIVRSTRKLLRTLLAAQAER